MRIVLSVGARAVLGATLARQQRAPDAGAGKRDQKQANLVVGPQVAAGRLVDGAGSHADVADERALGQGAVVPATGNGDQPASVSMRATTASFSIAPRARSACSTARAAAGVCS